jgi:inner membrane protein
MRWVVFATTLGYATHGLLDSCTTYGTTLFWPFSDARMSWRVVSVVDPLFTLPLLALIVVCLRTQARRWARVGLLWGALYLGINTLQQRRAVAVQRAAAEQRGHLVERSAVFPSIGNNITWRSVYQSEGRYYIDKIRVPWTLRACLTPGSNVPVAPPTPPDSELHPLAARADRLFRWFSLDWVAFDPAQPEVLGDIRYSFSPTEVSPVWGVVIDDTSGAVEWVNNRQTRGLGVGYLASLLGEDGPEHRCY